MKIETDPFGSVNFYAEKNNRLFNLFILYYYSSMTISLLNYFAFANNL